MLFFMTSHRLGPSTSHIFLTSRELRILQKLCSAHSTDQGLTQRAEIIQLTFRKWSKMVRSNLFLIQNIVRG